MYTRGCSLTMNSLKFWFQLRPALFLVTAINLLHVTSIKLTLIRAHLSLKCTVLVDTLPMSSFSRQKHLFCNPMPSWLSKHSFLLILKQKPPALPKNTELTTAVIADDGICDVSLRSENTGMLQFTEVI